MQIFPLWSSCPGPWGICPGSIAGKSDESNMIYCLLPGSSQVLGLIGGNS